MNKKAQKNSIPAANPRCLGCYQNLDVGIYHPTCSRKLFGIYPPPILSTTEAELHALATEYLNARHVITGVQRKLSLTLEGKEQKRLTLVGTLGGDFIMKPPSPDYPELPENEDLCMHLAEICGIQTAHHGLLPLANGSLAYVTRRFDRQKSKKIAVEDLCQLSGLLTEQKYRSSHESVGKIIRRHSSTPGDAALRYLEMVLFSFLIGNNDMHLKNFSLLTENPKNIILSPAYDLLSVRLVLSKKVDSEELALTTNGKKNKLSRLDFKSLAENLKIPEKVFNSTLAKLIGAKDSMFELIAQSFLNECLQNQLVDIIDSNCDSLTK